ncbi:MAG: hypothetical protein F4143_05570 [Gemmatimonadales bacterium]|nr:hypothetical protein [Gemmatimonadales bacterium]
MEAALAHGADEPREPMDYGFMYARAFADPDGHIRESFWLDLEAALAAGAPDVGDDGTSWRIHRCRLPCLFFRS